MSRYMTLFQASNTRGGERVNKIILIGTVICAIGWVKNRIDKLILSNYLVKKSIHPTDKELDECSRFVINKIFHIK